MKISKAGPRTGYAYVISKMGGVQSFRAVSSLREAGLRQVHCQKKKKKLLFLVLLWEIKVIGEESRAQRFGLTPEPQATG